MKYRPSQKKIPLHRRKAYNEKCLAALGSETPELSLEEIYQQYTGVGGLHGLHYVDYGNYHDFSEAKKEIEQGQFFTGDNLCQWVIDCIRPEEYHKVADLTCGKGSFLNQLSNESRLYGCEIDPSSFTIARRLFPEANLTLGDIRTYEPHIHFHIGASVADIRLSGSVTIAGTNAPNPYDIKLLSDYYAGTVKSVSAQEFETLLGRSIPNGSWSGTLDMNDAICQMYYAKSFLARQACKIMTNMLNKSIAKGEPDLNITFIYNMPFRGIAKMAGGMCTMEMAEGILTIVNGHFFKGLGRVIGGFFRSGKKRKAAAAMK